MSEGEAGIGRALRGGGEEGEEWRDAFSGKHQRIICGRSSKTGRVEAVPD